MWGRAIIIFALAVTFVFMAICNFGKSAIAERSLMQNRRALLQDSLNVNPHCVSSVDPDGELQIYRCDDGKTFTFRLFP